MLTSVHHYGRPCTTCLRGSWSGRVEIRLVDIKLDITGEAPALSGRPVIILGFVVNSLSSLPCVKYWAGQR